MSDGSPPPVVDVRGVSKFYEGNLRALDRVDLAVTNREFVAVTGPSGCGKSTLLHLVAALDVPSSGTVKVNGRDLREIKDLSRFRREEVGLVFQLHNLLPRLSVLANVEVVMFGTKRSRRERRSRALEVLREVDLSGREQRLPTQLSGGERQRVAIARALANEPPLLLADEPTGNLDSSSAARILRLFRRVNEAGVTLLLVTHDLSIADAADRTVRMHDGRVVGDDARSVAPSGATEGRAGAASAYRRRA
jgi:ABC-type lipoprotein export system ATPase subunit